MNNYRLIKQQKWPMSNEVDILENDIRDKYPEVLEILLRDHTTQKNIFWATDNYEHLGNSYKFNSEKVFLLSLITFFVFLSMKNINAPFYIF